MGILLDIARRAGNYDNRISSAAGMTVARRSLAFDKGTWHRRGNKIILVCPRCGAHGSLNTHMIDGMGVVYHRVKCFAPCTFDNSVVLKDWEMRSTEIH